jgi:hypothetical protein
MFIMKKKMLTRPLTFLANLIRFTLQVKSAFDLFSVVEAYLPELADKTRTISVQNLKAFVQTVETYFEIETPALTVGQNVAYYH